MPDKPWKIGLALGSGSAKGWSHIGVIRGLQEAGIAIDVVCGSSIGALVGGAFAAGKLDETERLARELSWTDVLGFMDVPVPRSGIINSERIARYLRRRLGDANIEDLPIPFAAVATDLTSGQEVWFREGSLIEAIRASISMPGMFTPCFRDGRLLVDGGLVNPVPVSLCRSLGAGTVIAVNPNTDVRIHYEITRDATLGGPPKAEAEKEEQGLRMRDLLFAGLTLYVTDRIKRGKSAITGRFAAKETGEDGRGLQDHLMGYLSDYINATLKQGKSLALGQITEDGTLREPAILEVILAAINLMGDRIGRQRLAGDPPDVMILPHVSHVGPLEFHRAEEVIEAGRRALHLMLPMLRDQIGFVVTI
ncbi:MAG: patatin [Syntrophaceae bacterium]|nr:patatin [Syntrophaceae bacterium]